MNTATRHAPVQLDSGLLRAAGRTPTVPFAVRLADGRALVVQQLLRVLPGKRMVGRARLDDQPVLAKLYIAGRSRHWVREKEGIDHLMAAGLPTPELLLSEPLRDGGHVLGFRFLDDAHTLLDDWQQVQHRRPGAPECNAVLEPAFFLLGRMHQQGITHADLHLDNFLRQGETLYIIDGDTVELHARQPLPLDRAATDLGRLIAQLPVHWEHADTLGPLLTAYGNGNPSGLPSAARLHAAVSRERNWRLKDYMSKVQRECTLFQRRKSFWRRSMALREHLDALETLLNQPDQVLEQGERLKSGNTCTIARCTSNGLDAVIKRYNIKHLLHFLSRFWRPSRAWHAWVAGNHLKVLGIPTPLPLAIIEDRFGWFRRRAWLITAHCNGIHLQAHLSPDAAPPEAEAEAILRLFNTLFRARITHGDLKATNLLWDGEQIQLIDLDAMRHHRSARKHKKAWRKDRARFLRNWPDDSELHEWLSEKLPPAR